MEQNFLESNFLQTIIMTITVCVTAIIYWNNKRNALQAAATILKLQIQDIEENIETLKAEAIVGNSCQNNHYIIQELFLKRIVG